MRFAQARNTVSFLVTQTRTSIETAAHNTALNREEIIKMCQPLKQMNELFVSTANRSLVGLLTSLSDIFAKEMLHQ